MNRNGISSPSNGHETEIFLVHTVSYKHVLFYECKYNFPCEVCIPQNYGNCNLRCIHTPRTYLSEPRGVTAIVLGSCSESSASTVCGLPPTRNDGLRMNLTGYQPLCLLRGGEGERVGEKREERKGEGTRRKERKERKRGRKEKKKGKTKEGRVKRGGRRGRGKGRGGRRGREGGREEGGRKGKR